MESKYYPATIEECYHGMEYEICEWFFKGVNGEDILTWKNNTEREVFCKWNPFKLDLVNNDTFINHRTSYNHFCFHVKNNTARVKTIRYTMTPQEELELLNDLYVADSPYDTQLNIATRIGELLDIVLPRENEQTAENETLFWERPE